MDNEVLARRLILTKIQFYLINEITAVKKQMDNLTISDLYRPGIFSSKCFIEAWRSSLVHLIAALVCSQSAILLAYVKIKNKQQNGDECTRLNNKRGKTRQQRFFYNVKNLYLQIQSYPDQKKNQLHAH